MILIDLGHDHRHPVKVNRDGDQDGTQEHDEERIGLGVIDCLDQAEDPGIAAAGLLNSIA